MTILGAKRREPAILLAITLAALAVSAVRPHDWITWALEVAPVVIGIPLLLWTRDSFPMTPLLYRLLFLHAIVLIVGGHYTYARVPLGNWMTDAFGFSRNHYDRIGHFLQGFEPAILARELFLRRSPLQRGKWLFYLVLCACLSFSACFELFEWGIAVLSSSQADLYLSTQGDIWDTQWDMLYALIGAILAQIILMRIHDRQLKRIGDNSGNAV